ncbi:hypothetical protein GEMRC1_003971 [Eukaryota sp. GEM-RC1]
MSSQTEDVGKALEKLREQNKRLAKHQEASYKWHLQHHANLKNVIGALNRLSELLNEKLDSNTHPLIAQEDSDLMATTGQFPSEVSRLPSQPLPTPSTGFITPLSVQQPQNLHQLVLRFQNNLYNQEFQNRLRNVSEDEFNTLEGIKNPKTKFREFNGNNTANNCIMASRSVHSNGWDDIPV